MTSRSAERLLPSRRSADSPYRIAVVCLGNICRSPMAEVVLTEKIRRASLATRATVVSAGTGDWHVGNPMDRRAAAALTANGYDASNHRATQFDSAWFEECDLILAMDESNLSDLASLGAASVTERLRMFRDFDPCVHDASASASAGDRDVPDPYYGGDDGFENVLAMVERTAAAIVLALQAEAAQS